MPNLQENTCARVSLLTKLQVESWKPATLNMKLRRMCFPVNFSKLLRILVELPQREKCPDTELFLVRIFLYSDRSTFHTVYTTRKNLLSLLKTALSGLRQFLAIEIPLKMMKNVFCFTSKAFFLFSRYLDFSFDFLVM